jgi:arsenate reductase-like glutaredoxin family protein
MNIQIFGTKKSNDSKKAERYFKERGIRFQYVDMREKGLSKGEFQSVRSAVGGLDQMIDRQAKDREVLDLLPHLSASDAEEKVFENQQVLLLPIVRNGKQATVGYQPDVWKKWE